MIYAVRFFSIGSSWIATGRHIKHKSANDVANAIPPMKSANKMGAENKSAIAKTMLPFRMDNVKYNPITLFCVILLTSRKNSILSPVSYYDAKLHVGICKEVPEMHKKFVTFRRMPRER